MCGDYLSGDVWSKFGIFLKYVVLINEPDSVQFFFQYGDIPHSLGDIPEISRRIEVL